jgi:GNAT superfamily N-acetyltransferase
VAFDSIRPADVGDLPGLIRHLGSEPFLRERLTLQRHGHGQLLVAFRGPVPVGHVYLWLAPAQEHEIRTELPGVPLLNRLVVDERHRNKGIGTALVDNAESRLRRLGHRQVALGVRVDNLGAIRLYRRLGYLHWRRPPIVAHPEDDLGIGRTGRATEIFTVFVKDLNGAGGPSAASHQV